MSEFDSDGVLAVIAIIVLFGILVLGLTTCSEHESALKKICIEAGGTVIPDGTQFRCVDPKVKP
jgi:hypothetical protein